MQGEVVQIRGRGHHVAIEVVADPSQGVEGEGVLPTVAQQADLVLVSLLPKELHRLSQGELLSRNGLIRRYDLSHPLLQPGQLPLAEGFPLSDLAEEAAQGQRVVNDDAGLGEELLCGHDQQEAEGAAVDAHTVAGGH